MSETTNLSPIPTPSPNSVEAALVRGDLSKLTEEQRLNYYRAVCESLGLNPLTRPFEYIVLNGRLTLYATRAATDQLRAIRGVSVEILSREERDGLYIVHARARDREGRVDEAIGAVPLVDARGQRLTGDALANAMMKAETKAKRRVTLSICGLGWLDETEVETIPNAQRVDAEAQQQPKQQTQQQVQQQAQQQPQQPAQLQSPLREQFAKAMSAHRNKLSAELLAEARRAYKENDEQAMKELLKKLEVSND